LSAFKETATVPFTLVFDGDLRDFKGNPLRTDTPFGKPYVCALGDLAEENEKLIAKLDHHRIPADDQD
jgi:hypothetical protein